jgi:hypothetical protein
MEGQAAVVPRALHRNSPARKAAQL